MNIRKQKFVALEDGFVANITWEYDDKTREILEEEVIVFTDEGG